ncbi:unnamed protein product [Heligmosomoides polygyrus]|uniref:Collagen IV NC1 domain-containing protein n=1 Tax=Heligmosomoides polygyrus TaxID=6339 RepID=A0A183GAI7_HELPZ|nr:unnamed protein product [Heligmosomoides polygyrus]
MLANRPVCQWSKPVSARAPDRQGAPGILGDPGKQGSKGPLGLPGIIPPLAITEGTSKYKVCVPGPVVPPGQPTARTAGWT